jgi:spermidine synthase
LVPEAPRPGDAFRLFSLGFVTLALELVLIRYLAGTIWNLGYFPNLVLLAVFVGMGCGFAFHARFTEARSLGAGRAAPWLLFALVALVACLHPTMAGAGEWMRSAGGELYFSGLPPQAGHDGIGLFAFWFFGVFAVFACLAIRAAKIFRRFSALRAYTLDISGSCAGILVFTTVSFLQLPAYQWFLIVAPFCFVALRDPDDRFGAWAAVLPLAFCATIAWRQDASLLSVPEYRGAREVHWSPYQRIELATNTLAIFSNGLAHQGMHARAELAGSYYEEPYAARARHPELPPYKSVLILGAGSGNDVMAALMNGAEHVDAVEIDPAIADIGRRVNPGHPYADARVTVTIDDARSFMTRSRRRYDLIVFALTDSLVKVSSMTQLRLENYLFTVDSFERARSLLSDDGDIVMYNFYRTPWLAEKLRRGLERAMGSPPELLLEVRDFKMLRAGRSPEVGRAAPSFDQGSLDLPSDDWPFLYLRERGVPSLYRRIMAGLFAGIAVLALALSRQRRAGSAGGTPEGASLATRGAFLLMGAAFLLLETKSLVQFSLLFGTTWLNNSLVFFGVLVLVLLANAAAARVRGRLAVPAAYALLLASCGVALLVPLGSLLEIESTAVRFVLACLLTFSPVFFANLIFSVVFREVRVPEEVFGWNLLGATAGGALEYLSMAFGYRALTFIVALTYTVAVALIAFVPRRHGAAAA